jgi:hypothetical protein
MRVFDRPVPNTLPVACPTCSAKAGEPCRMPTGQARHEPHFERQTAAEAGVTNTAAEAGLTNDASVAVPMPERAGK